MLQISSLFLVLLELEGEGNGAAMVDYVSKSWGSNLGVLAWEIEVLLLLLY